MTKARILSDYVSSGVTAAEFDFLDTTSGTPGATTFLRGDKTWQAAGGSTSASDLTSGTLASARLPAGAILQVQKGSYNTMTTIGTGQNYIIDLEFATKGASSTFIAYAYFVVGNNADAEGYWGGITLETGSTLNTPSTSNAMMIALPTDANDRFAFAYDDIANGRDNTYSVRFNQWQAFKDTSIAAATTISVGLWFEGNTAMYINRPNARSSHEGGLTTLVVYEVAT